jgi:hypothetical protein
MDSCVSYFAFRNDLKIIPIERLLPEGRTRIEERNILA